MQIKKNKIMNFNKLENILTLQDNFNANKAMQFKESNCGHFYYRQLINNTPVTKWIRANKKSVKSVFNSYYKGNFFK